RRDLLACLVPDPLGEILAVEQHNRVRRWTAGSAAGCDHARTRPVDVVHAPFLAGQDRRVAVTDWRFSIRRLRILRCDSGAEQEGGSGRPSEKDLSTLHTG